MTYDAESSELKLIYGAIVWKHSLSLGTRWFQAATFSHVPADGPHKFGKHAHIFDICICHPPCGCGSKCLVQIDAPVCCCGWHSWCSCRVLAGFLRVILSADAFNFFIWQSFAPCQFLLKPRLTTHYALPSNTLNLWTCSASFVKSLYCSVWACKAISVRPVCWRTTLILSALKSVWLMRGHSEISWIIAHG
jgi:hypothetical protein